MIYILIPVYNEAENLPRLMHDVHSLLPGREKLIVLSDDGSSDEPESVLEQYCNGIPYRILGDGINRGPGAAFNRGFEWILKNSSDPDDVVITMEADSTSDLNLLPRMLAIHELGYDLVLASVYAQGGGFDGTTFTRKLISSIANLVFRFLFDIKTLTLSSFYRVYDIGLLRKIKLHNGDIIRESGFICMLELLIKAIHENAQIIEIPMTLYSKKRIGKSRMKILKTSLQYIAFFIRNNTAGKVHGIDTVRNEGYIYK